MDIKYMGKSDDTVKKRNKYIKRFILALFILSSFVILIGLIQSLLSFFVKPTFDAPVPRNWKIQSESGEISSPCFGSWSECGSITREYTTGKDVQSSLNEMRLAAENEKWILMEDKVSNKKYNITRVSARDDREDWNRIVYLEFTDSHASIRYVKR
jgi:hypothetical protein